MNVRLKDITGTKAVLAEPSAEDLALIAGDEFAGQKVTPEDVHVREEFLCTDQYDRTYERFPKSYLDQFVLTLPGKSKLASHNTWNGLPLARYFRADLVVKMEDYPVPVEGRELPSWWWGDEDEDAAPEPDGWKDIIPRFENQRKKVTYLHPGYYFANDPVNESLRKNVDLGVYKWVSIGFRYDDLDCDICKASYFKSKCNHILGYVDKEGRICTGTYSGDPTKAEALEGSIVYLGAQPRARLIKQLQENAIDPVACAATPFGEDLVALKEAEALARQFGHKQKSWFFSGLREKAEPVFIPPKPEDWKDITEDLIPSSPAGERLEDTLESARAAVSGAIERVKGYAAKRAEDGRDISKDRYAQLLALQEDLNGLVEAVKPKADTIRQRELALKAWGMQLELEQTLTV